MDAVKKIYQTEGIMAFTKGFEACAWRHGLWNVGYFSVIKTVRESLPPSDVHTLYLLLLVSFLSRRKKER